MRENLALMRFFFVLLSIFTIGRWSLSLSGVDYDAGHQVFSLVILTNLAAAHYGAFARRFRGYSWLRAAGLGACLAVSSQLVIVGSTALSYALGLESFFNAPRALNVEAAVGLGEAMGIRGVGFVANVVTGSVAGWLGWLFGAVLPRAAQAEGGAA